MKDSTRDEYRKIAENFYKAHLRDLPPTAKRLKKTLINLQDDVRPNYWRKLKIAIAFDQKERGYSDVSDVIGSLKNNKAIEAEKKKDFSKIKPKSRRIKRISPQDAKKIHDAIAEKRDDDLTCAYLLARYTGCRPSEMPNISVGEGLVVIQGAKVGQGRGLPERRIRVPESVLPHIEKAARRLAGKPVGHLQDRFDRLMKKTFPRREKRPSLYSFRHQLGSDLKASKLTRKEIAYCMGHLSTASVDVYGDRRGGGGLKVRASKDADYSAIKEKHSLPPEALDKAMWQKEEAQSPGQLESSSKAVEDFLESALNDVIHETPAPARVSEENIERNYSDDNDLSM